MVICIAVVKIWKVKSNLKQVVDYAEDKEKTDLLKALEDKEKFSEIVKRNDEILNNITKYIEDNTNKKNKDLK